MKILAFMRRKAFRAVIRELAETDPESFLKKDGDVNRKAFADAVGVAQPTISRAMKDHKYEPSNRLVDALIAYFGITAAQARGEESLVGRVQQNYSGRIIKLADKITQLTPEHVAVIETMADTLLASTPSHKRQTQ